MFGILLESSHSRGFGHLYRSIVLAKEIQNNGLKCVLLLNNDPRSKKVLQDHELDFSTIDLKKTTDLASYIHSYDIKCLIVDRLQSDVDLILTLKNIPIFLVGIDEDGAAFDLMDIGIFNLAIPPQISTPKRKPPLVLAGFEYAIIDKSFYRFARRRHGLVSKLRGQRCNKITVMVGGTDTRNISTKVIDLLVESNISKTIDLFLGAGAITKFDGFPENVSIKKGMASIAEELVDTDLLICSGGVLCLEAIACGLPSLIIATEPHEVETAEFIQNFGVSRFLGFYKDIRPEWFDFDINLSEMSQTALKLAKGPGVENVVKELLAVVPS